MKKIQKTSVVKLTHPVSVHLGSTDNSSPQQVFSAELECTPEGFVQRLTGKPEGKFRVKVDIVNLNGLQVDDATQLLQVDLGGKTGSDLCFQVKEHRTPFNVLFFASHVIDGSVNNLLVASSNGEYSAKYEIEYTVSVFDTDKKNIQVGETLIGKLDVVLQFPKDVALAYSAQLISAVDELHFSTLTGEDNPFADIAILKVSHAAGLRCAPSTCVNFKIEAMQYYTANKADGAYPALNSSQICVGSNSVTDELLFEESHPVRPHAHVAAESNATALVLEDRQSSGYRISNLYGFNSDNSKINIVSIPIRIDRSVLKNPVDECVDIQIRVNHWLEGTSQISTEELYVPLRKNTNLVELKSSVSFSDEQGKTEVKEFKDVPNLELVKLAPVALGAGLEATATITLLNAAETVEDGHPNAGIIISDFELGDVRDPARMTGEVSRIKTKAGHGMNVNKIFSVVPLQPHSLPIVLHCSSLCDSTNLWLNRLDFVVKYSAREILDIVPRKDAMGRYIYAAEVVVPFSFHYMIDAKGDIASVCDTNPAQFLVDHGMRLSKATGELHVHLEKSLAPEWLCVDFGTSAVVALYGANATRNQLLPINGYRTGNVIPLAYPSAEATQRFDDSEKSADFLPTVVYLNKDNNGDYMECKPVEAISKSPIWFSPTTGMTAARLDYQLPSLKLMLGFDYLPDIFSSRVHQNFKYTSRDESGHMQTLHLKEEMSTQLTEICRVDNLIRQIYEQLFTYYLRPSVDGVTRQQHTQLNKLILTIPNTFTPDNIAMLKDMVARLVPTLHYDQIRFVSESDAVACHYLSNESQFNAQRTSGKEYLLVFDMGAGTLDLTYIERERAISNKSNSQIIRIEGKMGVNKAGNYMDYMIASVLHNLLKEKLESSASTKSSNKTQPQSQVLTVSPSSVSSTVSSASTPSLGGGLNAPELGGGLQASPLGGGLTKMVSTVNSKDLPVASNTLGVQMQELLTRIESLLTLQLSNNQSQAGADNELKNYVNRQVKPLLSGDPSQQLPPIKIGREYPIPLCVRDILEAPEFKSYIEETTSQVLANFQSMFANEDGELPIDTLIFSGRSTHLLDIRRGVIKFLTDENNNPKAQTCRFADMGTMSYVNRETGLSEKKQSFQSDGLKTAVAQGALSYVSFFSGVENAASQMITRNIYANYGILWNNANGWHYDELIGRTTIPYVKATTPTDGIYIDQYRVNKSFDFSHESVGEMMLIQTYSQDPAADWEKHNFEMISVLVRLENCDAYNSHKGAYNLELQVDAANRFTFKIGGQQVTVNPHVDFNDEALRKSIWPVLFSKTH